MVERFLNHPPLEAMQNPITILNIWQHQFEDVPLNQRIQQFPYLFPVKHIEGRPLIFYRPYENTPEGDWKIALPTSLINPVLHWYHHVLGHTRVNRMYDTI